MRLAFVGDVMLGRLVNQELKTRDPAYPWGNTLLLLQDADLRICNLECVVSDIGQPWSATPKVFHFRTDEKNIQTLLLARMDIVSIANNHVLDYEYEAFQRMLDILDKNRIHRAGAGKNRAEAMKPGFLDTKCQRLDVRNQKIALIAFTDNEPGWEAKENKPGIYYIPTHLNDSRMQTLLDNIEILKEQVDFLIISAHWGSNWGYDPPEEHVHLAHAMIDSGADLIFGHSGHVFRGVEVYKHKPIIYCAGDFIDDYAVDEVEKNDESFIFVFENDHHLNAKLFLYPTCISHFQAQIPSGQRKKEILSKMERLCRNLGTILTCHADHAVIEL